MTMYGGSFDVSSIQDFQALARDLAKLEEIKQLEEGTTQEVTNDQPKKQVRSKRSKSSSS